MQRRIESREEKKIEEIQQRKKEQEREIEEVEKSIKLYKERQKRGNYIREKGANKKK